MPDNIIGSPFPQGYPPSLAADMLTRQIFAIPFAELDAEMDRLDAARHSSALSAKVSYSLFILKGLLRRRLEGVSEAEIHDRAAAWAAIFGAQ